MRLKIFTQFRQTFFFVASAFYFQTHTVYKLLPIASFSRASKVNESANMLLSRFNVEICNTCVCKYSSSYHFFPVKILYIYKMYTVYTYARHVINV